jgi:hypothetical protein
MTIETLRWAGALLLVFALHGCTKSNSDYLPLAVGRQWDYAVTRTGLSDTREQRVVRVDEVVSRNGQSVAVVAEPPHARNYYTVDREGVRRVATARGVDGVVTPDVAGHYVLRHPGSSPTTWTLASALALVEERIDEGVPIRDQKVRVEMTMRIASTDDEVVVPAGRFMRCLRIDGSGSALVAVHKGETTARVDVTSSDWYAPGIGLVKSVRREDAASDLLIPGTFTQELTEVR